MFWIVIAAFAWLFVSAGMIYGTRVRGNADTFFDSFILLIIFALLSALGNVVSTSFYKLEFRKIDTREIVSIQDSTGAGGEFFLGTGSINTDMYYFMYLRSGDGYELRKLPADKVKIKNSDSPRLVVYENMFKKESNFWTIIEGAGEQSFRIYVPEGSIKHKFKLNAK